MINMASTSTCASPSAIVPVAAEDEFQVEGSEVTICETFKHGPLTSRLTIYGTREQPLFRLREVEQLLGKSNLLPTVRGFDDEEKVRKNVSTIRGVQEVIFLTEEGIITLMHHVRGSPIAKTFRRWVAQVVKKIMLEGRYELPGASQKLLQDAETARAAAEKRAQEVQEQADRDLNKVREELARAVVAKDKATEKAEELRRKIEHKKQKGQCIYLLQNAADADRRLYKAGHSKDLSKREFSYRTSMPDGVDVLHCVYTRDAVLAEKIFQHILDKFHYAGEWYQGDPQLFSQVITAVASFLDGMVESLDNVVPFKTAERIGNLLRKAKAFAPGEDDGAESDGSSTSVIINGPVNGNVTVHVNNSPKRSLEELLRLSKIISHEHGCSTRLDHLREALSKEFGWTIKQLTPRKAFTEFNPAFIVHPDIRACHMCDSVEGSGCCPGYEKNLGKKVGLVRNMRLQTPPQEGAHEAK